MVEMSSMTIKSPDGDYVDYEVVDQKSREDIEKLTEDFNNIAFEETDPTVPDWAKQSTKPAYTAEEVGALPNTTKIPSKTSDLQNDSGFLTEHQSLTDYAKKTDIPTDYAKSDHTHDQYLTSVPSEYVTESELNAKGYLTEHQSLADYAKTSQIPTKVSQLTNDSKFLTSVPSEYVTETELSAKGYLTQHQSLNGYAKTADHYTKTESDNKYQPKGNYLTSVPSEYVTESELSAKKYLTAVPSEYVTDTELTAKGYASQSEVDELSGEIADHTEDTGIHVTSAEKTAWNNKSNFSGAYADLTGKPTIPSLTGYATETYVKNYSQPKGSYATQASVDSLSSEVADLKAGNVTVPDYWVDELETKANAIQVAMEKAGKNKSAFLWYTDAHWINGNSKVSPMLLNYLYMNTPMNKVNFGGDIIGDTLLATRDEMTYLYEWRKAIKDLPNHHSVFGNHDMFDLTSVDYENDNYRYAFLLAPEETPDIVWGDGNYYYIDNPAEKTRYLYIAYMTSDLTAMMAQGQFICDSIKSVPEGWHIVAIAHRWWQYSSSSTPTVGSIPAFETDMLDIFDKYNARATRSGSNYFYAQDFTDAKGKVEFCIGGHIHVDYDFFSNGGIPVIITTADTNQNRVPDSTVDSGTVGTITESAVFGIIADYNEEITKITVVGVGRGTSRVVRASSVTPKSISNITYSGDTTIESAIDKSKFSFTVNYSDGTTSSVTGANTVTPATIGTVGNNSVTITYIENGITLTGTATIVGTPKPVVNLFDKNDPDVLLRGRINSSAQAVAFADGQLVTGWIEGKLGDTFNISSDKSQVTNGYTGTICAYDANKAKVHAFTNPATATGGWTWSSDYLSGEITLPASYGNTDCTATAWVRFCIAYTDIDSIVITKS